MKVKSVSFIRDGDILAEPIFTNEKTILLPKGTILKKEYAALIQSLEIDTIMIEDPYEKWERPNFIMDPQRMNYFITKIKNLMEKHIYNQGKSLREIEVLAHELVTEVCAKPQEGVMDLKERTSDLYEHTIMVTLLSLMIGSRLQLEEDKLREIAIGCLLHDIGIRYITVPYENIDLHKMDPASVFEYKKHTILGYSALEKETWIPLASKNMVLFHHEKLDGSGFPMKQKNRETECRLIQVCDAYDRMISGMEEIRTHVWSARSRLKEKAGICYEKKMTELLLSMTAAYPAGTVVRIDGDEEGVVVSQTDDPERPVVLMTASKEEKNLMTEKHISILSVV